MDIIISRITRMKNENSAIDNWDEHWDKYQESASENPAQIYRHKLIVDEILKISRTSETQRIMDIGCGQGDLLASISTLFSQAEFVGLELSETGVATTLKKNPNAVILQEDILNPSNEAAQFYGWANIICCSEVMEHIDNPGQFLDHLSKYICEDGYLILTVPGGPMSSFDKFIGHRRHFNKDSLIQLIAKSKKFLTIQTFRSGFPFFNLYRLIVILRGKKLQSDVQSEVEQGITNQFALKVMKIFRYLFKFNLRDSLFGWQMLVIAQLNRNN
jgi:2-polyprenyl-3-methyl-5-hydroxy-6-metoxy-1,4-benzoquinol methylase